MVNPQEFPDAATPGAEEEVSEKIECLIGPRRTMMSKAMGVQPMSARTMRSALSVIERQHGCEVVRVIRPRHALKTLSTSDEATTFYKVKMDVDSAIALLQTAPPNMTVESDSNLSYDSTGVSPLMRAILAQRLGALRETKGIAAQQVRLRLLGENNEPVPKARVTLEGEGFPQEGQTDKNGVVTLALHTTPTGRARSLFVSPPKDYWTRYMRSPALNPNAVNVIRMQSLRQTVPGFPDRYRHGWGQVLMGLDQIPDEFTGKGVKIAIIDSGADNKHPCLGHITQGFDLTNDDDTTTWANDVVGHGSHCSGVIAAQSAGELALRGFVPDAEIHVLKVFPGGQFSSLLDALSYCIELEVDVVNMSLGSADASDAVEQQLEEALQHGIACIAAAGNSGGPVQYPARSRNVLAVAAVGMLNEFPQNTWESQTIVPSLVAPDGIFSPSFTCLGSEVAVCAPGVGIISTVPDNGFEPQSGTSMAAPHVTGLAALLVAHHPAFKGALRDRNAQRVAGLFSLVRSICTQYQLGAERTGAGIPKLHSMVPVFQNAIKQPEAGTKEAATAGGIAVQPAAAQAGFAAMAGVPQATVGGGLGQYSPAQFAGAPAGLATTIMPLQATHGLVPTPGPLLYGMGTPILGLPYINSWFFR